MNEDKQPVRVPNLNPEDMTEEMFELIAKKLEDDSDEESENLHNPVPFGKTCFFFCKNAFLF